MQVNPSMPGSTGGTGGTMTVTGDRSHGTTSELRQEAAGQARKVGEEAGQQARQVAETARQEGRTVAAEIKGSVRAQVDTQRDRAAESLRSLGSGMREMAGDRDDRLAGVMTEVAQRVDDVSRWMKTHETAEMLRSVEDFARRRPGMFLAGAALLGIVAGRLTRGIAAGSPDGNGTSRYDDTLAGTTTGSDGGYLPGPDMTAPEAVTVVTATPPLDDPSVLGPVVGDHSEYDPLRTNRELM